MLDFSQHSPAWDSAVTKQKKSSYNFKILLLGIKRRSIGTNTMKDAAHVHFICSLSRPGSSPLRFLRFLKRVVQEGFPRECSEIRIRKRFPMHSVIRQHLFPRGCPKKKRMQFPARVPVSPTPLRLQWTLCINCHWMRPGNFVPQYQNVRRNLFEKRFEFANPFAENGPSVFFLYGLIWLKKMNRSA